MKPYSRCHLSSLSKHLQGCQPPSVHGVPVRVLHGTPRPAVELSLGQYGSVARDGQAAGDTALGGFWAESAQAMVLTALPASRPRLTPAGGVLSAEEPRGTSRRGVGAVVWTSGAVPGVARRVAAHAGRSVARPPATGHGRPSRAAPPSDSQAPGPKASRLPSTAVPPPAYGRSRRCHSRGESRTPETRRHRACPAASPHTADSPAP